MQREILEIPDLIFVSNANGGPLRAAIRSYIRSKGYDPDSAEDVPRRGPFGVYSISVMPLPCYDLSDMD